MQSINDIQYGFNVFQPTKSTLLITVSSMSFEIELNLVSYEITIRAPYSLFGGKFDGLCGKHSRF